MTETPDCIEGMKNTMIAYHYEPEEFFEGRTPQEVCDDYEKFMEVLRVEGAVRLCRK